MLSFTGIFATIDKLLTQHKKKYRKNHSGHWIPKKMVRVLHNELLEPVDMGQTVNHGE